MAWEPTGPIAIRYAALRRTIAYSATFQALTDSATEEQAAERVIFPDMQYLPMRPEDPAEGFKYPRTRAIIDLKEDQWSILPVGVGYSEEEYPTVVRLEIRIPESWQGTNILDDDVLRNQWCEEMWRAVLQDMIDASRLGVHPTTGEKFIGDTCSFAVEREGMVDVTLPENDIYHETFYAAELTITDASGV